jgi:hypothetical protein
MDKWCAGRHIEPFAHRYAGCDFRLTDVHGKAVNESIA